MSELKTLLRVIHATASAIAAELETLRENAQTALDDAGEDDDTDDLSSAVDKIETSIENIDDVSNFIEAIAEELEISLDD